MLIRKKLYTTEQSFHDFLISHNHPLRGEMNYDTNNFHPLKCPNGSNTDARYKLYPDGNGYLKCWKCNIEVMFFANHAQRIEPNKFIPHDCMLEIQTYYTKVAELASKVFAIADNTKASQHGYLQKKHVRNYGLRVLTHENKITHEAKCYPGTLLVPCYDINNNLVNLERIYFDKKEMKFQKRPLSGARRNGAFHLIGEILNSQSLIYLAEGYATAATIYEATGCATITAFNCGNLKYVAEVIHKKYPQIKIIITGDRDADQSGEIHAKKTIGLTGGAYVLPNFSMIPDELRPDIKRSDFNDLFVLLMAMGLNRTAALSKVQQQIQTIY